MRKIYLITTEHLEEGLWFRDTEDFKVAMSYVAVEALQHPKGFVLAFILMSNHVHFVLKGTRKEVVDFVNRFKKRYSIYYQHKYGIKEFLRGNGLDVKEIPYDDEAVERAIAYVLMNCVAAGICAHPSQYPWGTGALFFNAALQAGALTGATGRASLGSPGRATTCSTNATPAGSYSARALAHMLHSKCPDIPQEWIIGNNGYILPQNYADVAGVEKLFRTPQRFNFFLRTSSKARKRLALEENLPAFKDQTILAALPDLSRSLFQKESFQELSEPEQAEFARQIRFRFSADATQIARVCGVSYAQAARLLDSV